MHSGHNYVFIVDCEIHSNSGASLKKLLIAKIYNCLQSYKTENRLLFHGSKFYNNVNNVQTTLP